jgi:hypothetical protein
MSKEDQPRKWRRGDVHPVTGLVFWAYDKRRATGEQWMSAEAVQVERARQRVRCSAAMRGVYASAMETPEGRLKWALRTRTRVAFGAIAKGKPMRAAAMFGADAATIRAWIESMFLDGMTWGNMGAWHVDHILPLATAKSTDELVQLCHYTNLRPLWAADNLSRPDDGSDLLSHWPRRSAPVSAPINGEEKS